MTFLARVLPAIWLWLVIGAGELGAQWRVSGQGEVVALAGGATQVQREVSGPVEARLKLVFFSRATHEVRVVDQEVRSQAGSLEAAMQKLGATAGCNGGYFTPEFAPLGLAIAQGKRSGAFQKSSLLGGVLVVRKGAPRLVWRDEFVEQSGTTELLQAGPRLVHESRPVVGLDAGKRRPRTFVLTDGEGRWAMGTCDHASLAELAGMLATPGIVPEMKVRRALNLDGGRSSALWFRRADGSTSYDREMVTVRNFVAVVPR